MGNFVSVNNSSRLFFLMGCLSGDLSMRTYKLVSRVVGNEGVLHVIKIQQPIDLLSPPLRQVSGTRD